MLFCAGDRQVTSEGASSFYHYSFECKHHHLFRQLLKLEGKPSCVPLVSSFPKTRSRIAQGEERFTCLCPTLHGPDPSQHQPGIQFTFYKEMPILIMDSPTTSPSSPVSLLNYLMSPLPFFTETHQGPLHN